MLYTGPLKLILFFQQPKKFWHMPRYCSIPNLMPQFLSIMTDASDMAVGAVLLLAAPRHWMVSNCLFFKEA